MKKSKTTFLLGIILIASIGVYSTQILYPHTTNTALPKTNNKIIALNTDAQTDLNQNNQNDLIYHDYKSALSLSKTDSLSISELDLNLPQNETADIYAFNVKKGTYKKIAQYTKNQLLVFTPTESGVYEMVAITKTNEKINLNEMFDCSIQTQTNDDPSNAIVLN